MTNVKVKTVNDTVKSQINSALDWDENTKTATVSFNAVVDNAALENSILINKWLMGYRTPSGSGGRVVKPANVDTFIDWYAYENRSGLNRYVTAQFNERQVIATATAGSYGELKDQNSRTWIAAGPRVINPNYPDDGDCTVSEQLIMGKKVDAELKDLRTGEIIYIYCRIGDIKAHTYISTGHSENGISQTGIPYPNNASGEGADLASANGNTVEFMGYEGENGDLSAYELIRVIVYD